MLQWTLLGIAILGEVAGTLALRAAEGFTKPLWAVATAVGYVVAFVLLGQVLRLGVPVGVAYGIWAGAGVVLTAIAGRVLWGDPLTALMGLGIALTVIGVLLIELGAGQHS